MMTRRFVLQCHMNGIEADRMLDLLGILERIMVLVSEAPDGRMCILMDQCEFSRLKETVGIFSNKLGGFADCSPGSIR